jgi:hypothetical protein
MATTKNDNQCAHPGCNCSATSDSKYCSAYCETTAFETICGCGHAECSAQTGQSAAVI